MSESRLFHIVERQVWAEAVAADEYCPPSLADEGFVHFSFARQVAGTANLLYRDAVDPIVVEIDPARLDAEIRVEDSYGSGTEFPHVYGPVPVAAVVEVHPLRRDAAGGFSFDPAGFA